MRTKFCIAIVAAGLLLSAVPALIVYIIFQQQIIRGLSVGAIK